MRWFLNPNILGQLRRYSTRKQPMAMSFERLEKGDSVPKTGCHVPFYMWHHPSQPHGLCSPPCSPQATKGALTSSLHLSTTAYWVQRSLPPASTFFITAVFHLIIVYASALFTVFFIHDDLINATQSDVLFFLCFFSPIRVLWWECPLLDILQIIFVYTMYIWSYVSKMLYYFSHMCYQAPLYHIDIGTFSSFLFSFVLYSLDMLPWQQYYPPQSWIR